VQEVRVELQLRKVGGRKVSLSVVKGTDRMLLLEFYENFHNEPLILLGKSNGAQKCEEQETMITSCRDIIKEACCMNCGSARTSPVREKGREQQTLLLQKNRIWARIAQPWKVYKKKSTGKMAKRGGKESRGGGRKKGRLDSST